MSMMMPTGLALFIGGLVLFMAIIVYDDAMDNRKGGKKK